MPVKIDAPGARACQATGFGDASPYGVMGAEHFRIAGGADLGAAGCKGLTATSAVAPLGLPDLRRGGYPAMTTATRRS